MKIGEKLMKIEKIKKVGNKYKIEFDNHEKLTTYDDVILENGLLYHPEIDANILNKITIDHNFYDVYYKSIQYISKRLRSEKEMKTYLNKYNANEKDKKEIIHKLKEIGLVNDENFVKAYVSDKIHLSTSGPYKIKKELLEHDIEESIIEKELRKIDNEDLYNKMVKLITKKVKNSKYTGYYLKQKVVNEMSNLGYDKQEVIAIFEHLDKDDSSLLQKEYEKNYKKLSNKYSGKELTNKLKQKLYQKGFALSDIQMILEEHFIDFNE